MLSIYELKKGVKKSSLSKITARGQFWINIVSPTKRELKKIHPFLPLDNYLLKQALDQNERPHIHKGDKFSVIFIQSPYKEGHDTSSSALTIILIENIFITISINQLDSVNIFEQELLNGMYPDYSPDYLCFELFSSVIEDYFKIMDQLEEDIDHLENLVVHHPTKKLIQRIFNLKKMMIYFHKALNANREVISAIEKRYLPQIKNKNLVHFNSLYHDIVQLIDMEATYRDIVTGSLEMYMSSVSNNLNEVMKRLTVIASFLLLPTLISGIYGMNFQKTGPLAMPELYWVYGYPFALGIMAISIFIMYLYFKRKGLL